MDKIGRHRDLKKLLDPFSKNTITDATPWRGSFLGTFFVWTLLFLSGCATPDVVPSPRSLIIRSGARIPPQEERVKEIDVWVRIQQENIRNDPTFWIIGKESAEDLYPWDSLRISSDTAEVFAPSSVPEAWSVLSMYGHFHLMKKMGRIGEFLPEAIDSSGKEAEGYELEKLILSRLSDAWMFSRSAYDMSSYGPLDELMYSKENGYLEAFILTARATEFKSESASWKKQNPAKVSEYQDWFLETFERKSPSLR